MILMAESAQQPQKLRISLNLLHPKEASTKLPEKFLKWLISYGRFIVIFVEIIVVGAFLARFKLDADLDNLKRQINLDLPYVEGFATDEALIKQVQTKLGIIDKAYLNADKWQETVLYLSAQIPQSITFIALTLDEKDEESVNFKISGTTFSNSDLGIFLNSLRGDDSFREVNLASIIFDRQQIVFTITGVKKKR
jgi:hypothetical protein